MALEAIPEGASLPTTINWSSSNTNCISITPDETGATCTMTFNGPGESTIMVQHDATFADLTMNITVEVKLESIKCSYEGIDDFITGQTDMVTFSPVPENATMPKITVYSANKSIIDFDANGYAPENNIVVVPFSPKTDGDTSVTISNDGGVAEETMVVRADANNIRVFVNDAVYKIQHKSSACSLNGYGLIGGLVSDEFIFDHWEVVSGDATIKETSNLATEVQLGTEDAYIISKYKAESIKIIPRPDDKTSHPADELWGNGNMVTTFSVEPYPKDAVVPEVTFTSSDPSIIRITGTNRGSYSGTPGNCTITADATVAGGNRLRDTVEFVMTNDCVVTVNGSNAATTGAGTYDYTQMTRVTVDAGDPISADRGFAGWKLIKGDEIQFKNAFGDGSNKSVSFYPFCKELIVEATWFVPLNGIKFKDDTPKTQEFGSYQLYTVEPIPAEAQLPDEIKFSTSSGVLVNELDGPQAEGGNPAASVYLFAARESGTETITVVAGGIVATTRVEIVAPTKVPADFIVSEYNRSLVGFTGAANENLTIPATFTKGIQYNVIGIKGNAFMNCSNLTSVTVPDSVKSIATGAFRGCTGLTSITLPNSITEISDYTFYKCSSLNTINLPNTITSIGSMAFSDCVGLKSITISNGVKTIGGNVFSGCTGMTEINIPNSVETIDSYAFKGCTALKTINVDAYKDTIPGKTWNGPSVDPNITVNWLRELFDIDAEGRISKSAEFTRLNGANKLPTSITIPETIGGKTVTIIGEGLFNMCFNLESVVIPNTVTTIEANAFSWLESMETIDIPASVTSIAWDANGEAGAFSNSDCITTINVDKEEGSIRYAPWNAQNATVNWLRTVS